MIVGIGDVEYTDGDVAVGDVGDVGDVGCSFSVPLCSAVYCVTFERKR